MTYKTKSIIPPHGGYRNLKSFQMAEIVYDLTKIFCDSYMTYRTNMSYRTYDQMFQAARSGKQNIAEASQASGTSKKTEIKLVGVARASLEELLQDYRDFLRQREMVVWGKDDTSAQKVRALAYRSYRSYKTYIAWLSEPGTAANCIICLIHQTNFLLDQQIRRLEKDLLEKGGFTEKLYQQRRNNRGF